MKPLSFKELGLCPSIVSNLEKIGYSEPTQIQAKSIPVLLTGRDLVGQAQTGTGKTAAFALPLINNLNVKKKSPQILVLTPTRELAIQVYDAFKTYASGMKNYYGVPIYGGQSMTLQLRDLKRGAQVVVGTPGRVMDHIRRKTLKLDDIQTVVLDEADEMLKMGFVEDIEWILEKTPKEKQVALFSATMPTAIKRIAKMYQTDAQEIKIKSKTSTASNVKQYFCIPRRTRKIDALVRFLGVEKTDAVIVFARTKAATVEVTEQLQKCGYSAMALNGDLTQALRERAINKLKKGEINIIVATDVEARGIDVERVSHVFNFDIPTDPESYVHRIGRTGRAGRSGTAISLISGGQTRTVQMIERSTKQSMEEISLPSIEGVTQRRTENFKNKIVEVLNKQDLKFFKKIVKELSQESNEDMGDIASALCFLAQQDSPIILKEKAVRREDRGGRRSRNDRSSRNRSSRDRRGGGRRTRSSGGKPGSSTERRGRKKTSAKSSSKPSTGKRSKGRRRPSR